MAEHVIIDGNNLLHAMYAHAPIPHVAREKLVRIVEDWARRHGGDSRREDSVTLVFDGPVPRGGLARQMSSACMDVRFSAPETADDVIVRLIHAAQRPDTLRIVTSDKAIRHEARHRRCRHVDSTTFVAELFPDPARPEDTTGSVPEKPEGVPPAETDAWIDAFGLGDDGEPFDGFDAMTQ